MLKRDFVTVRGPDEREVRVVRAVGTVLTAYWPDLFEIVDRGMEDKAMRPAEDKCQK